MSRVRSFVLSRPFQIVSVRSLSASSGRLSLSQVVVPDRSSVSGGRRPCVVVRSPAVVAGKSSAPQDGTVGRTDVNAAALPRWNIFPSTYEEARGGKAVLGNQGRSVVNPRASQRRRPPKRPVPTPESFLPRNPATHFIVS